MKTILQIQIFGNDGRRKFTVRGLIENEQAIRNVVNTIVGNDDQLIIVEQIVEEPIEPIEA